MRKAVIKLLICVFAGLAGVMGEASLADVSLRDAQADLKDFDVIVGLLPSAEGLTEEEIDMISMMWKGFLEQDLAQQPSDKQELLWSHLSQLNESQKFIERLDSDHILKVRAGVGYRSAQDKRALMIAELIFATQPLGSAMLSFLDLMTSRAGHNPFFNGLRIRLVEMRQSTIQALGLHNREAQRLVGRLATSRDHLAAYLSDAAQIFESESALRRFHARKSQITTNLEVLSEFFRLNYRSVTDHQRSKIDAVMAEIIDVVYGAASEATFYVPSQQSPKLTEPITRSVRLAYLNVSPTSGGRYPMPVSEMASHVAYVLLDIVKLWSTTEYKRLLSSMLWTSVGLNWSTSFVYDIPSGETVAFYTLRPITVLERFYSESGLLGEEHLTDTPFDSEERASMLSEIDLLSAAVRHEANVNWPGQRLFEDRLGFTVAAQQEANLRSDEELWRSFDSLVEENFGDFDNSAFAYNGPSEEQVRQASDSLRRFQRELPFRDPHRRYSRQLEGPDACQVILLSDRRKSQTND